MKQVFFVLSTLHAQTHLFLITTMRGSSFHFPHFTDEDEIRRLSLVQFYTRGVTARLPTQLGLKTPGGWAHKPQGP